MKMVSASGAYGTPGWRTSNEGASSSGPEAPRRITDLPTIPAPPPTRHGERKQKAEEAEHRLRLQKAQARVDKAAKRKGIDLNAFEEQYHRGIHVHMYQEQYSSDVARQQEIGQWYHWITNLSAQGPWAQYVRTQVDEACTRLSWQYVNALEATYDNIRQNELLFEACNQELNQYQEWRRQQAASREQLQQTSEQSHYHASSAEASTPFQPQAYSYEQQQLQDFSRYSQPQFSQHETQWSHPQAYHERLPIEASSDFSGRWDGSFQTDPHTYPPHPDTSASTQQPVSGFGESGFHHYEESSLEGHWHDQASSSRIPEHHTQATDVPREQEHPSEVSHNPESPARFGTQALTGHNGVFPKINLDHITNPAEKQTYNNVLHHYAQAFLEEARRIYANISQHYDVSQTYCKYYGLTQLVAVCDIRNNKVFVGASQNALNKHFGISINVKHLYRQMNIQEVSEHLQNSRSVEWALPNIQKPLYKYKEECKGKRGSVGLYTTDNHARIAQEYGGDKSIIPILTTPTIPQTRGGHKTTGPWTSPEGADPVQPQIHGARKQKHGEIFRW
jgi:hypothetical protein